MTHQVQYNLVPRALRKSPGNEVGFNTISIYIKFSSNAVLNIVDIV